MKLAELRAIADAHATTVILLAEGNPPERVVAVTTVLAAFPVLLAIAEEADRFVMTYGGTLSPAADAGLEGLGSALIILDVAP